MFLELSLTAPIEITHRTKHLLLQTIIIQMQRNRLQLLFATQVQLTIPRELAGEQTDLIQQPTFGFLHQQTLLRLLAQNACA